MKPVGQLLKDSARFATTVTPWIFVVFWGRLTFHRRGRLSGDW